MVSRKEQTSINEEHIKMCEGLEKEKRRLEEIRNKIMGYKEMEKEVKEITKYINGIERLKKKFEKFLDLDEQKKRK